MKVWDRLITNPKREKRRRKTIVCINLKQTSTKFGVALCGVQGNAVKAAYISHIKKTYMDEFINVYHAFISDISRCIATFCGLKKRTKSSLF